MGHWRITVKGHGCHHNTNPAIDADLAAKEFVSHLVAQGHDVEEAVFEVTDNHYAPTTGVLDVDLLDEIK